MNPLPASDSRLTICLIGFLCAMCLAIGGFLVNKGFPQADLFILAGTSGITGLFAYLSPRSKTPPIPDGSTSTTQESSVVLTKISPAEPAQPKQP